jgi:hypothetical protein
MSDMKMNVQSIKLVLVGFCALMGVGVLMVMNQDQSEEEIASATMLRTTQMLNSEAQRSCKKAIKEKVGGNVYAATGTDSDQMTYMELTWKKGSANKTNKKCRFVAGKGVVLLEVDGKKLIEKL